MGIHALGRWPLLLLALAVPALLYPARAASAPASQGGAETISRGLADAPLKVHSWEKEGLLGAEVSGQLDVPFSQVRQTLTRPEAWCAFLPLVFNIKSCTYAVKDGRDKLTVYVGRKFYETPEEAYRINYGFHVQDQGEDSFRIFLFAREGPHGTEDYRIEVDVERGEGGSTALRMHSSFRPSLRSTLATNLYLATSGSDKVGFSIEGYEEGKPVYVDGKSGIVERNAMRYYLALKAYFDTLDLPPKKRLEARLDAWYDLTAQYPRQLYEMEKEEYLSAKRQEWEQQKQLQGAVNLHGESQESRDGNS